MKLFLMISLVCLLLFQIIAVYKLLERYESSLIKKSTIIVIFIASIIFVGFVFLFFIGEKYFPIFIGVAVLSSITVSILEIVKRNRKSKLN
jgi:hypothetical protein